MSHASARVLFDDGEVLHTEYNGTTDAVTPRLFRTYKEMRANWRVHNNEKCECGGHEPVIYWTSYGGGWTFEARACRGCMVVVSGEPFPQLGDDGTPDWVVM